MSEFVSEAPPVDKSLDWIFSQLETFNFENVLNAFIFLIFFLHFSNFFLHFFKLEPFKVIFFVLFHSFHIWMLPIGAEVSSQPQLRDKKSEQKKYVRNSAFNKLHDCNAQVKY